MINNRMLAVAAVLVMAVPVLGAATPIVVPPVPEQLVEGHTVFTVIEIVAATQTNETRFAAAVAVLVREYRAEERAQRFPGVLWFNDQYLVNPYQNARDNAAFRYPCGGAVLAVNRGDPDPRMVIARVNAGNPGVQADMPDGVDDVAVAGGSIGSVTYGDDSYTYTYPPWNKPYPGNYYYGQNNTGPDGVAGTADDNQNAPSDYAWIGLTPDQTTVNATNPSVTGQTLYSDTVVGATLGGADAFLMNATPPWDYRESYLITDPNDHTWVIDKYEFYTRDSNVNSQNANNLQTKLFDDVPMFDSDGDGIPDTQPSEHWPAAAGGGGMLETQYAYPVWAVNMLGSPVFVPDNGVALRIGNQFVGENCAPFKDLLEDVTAPLNGAACGLAVDDPLFNPMGTDNDSDITLNAYNGVPPWTDDPCRGYAEPSANGFCYGGQPAADANGDGVITKEDCLAERSIKPLRQYNALLYFKLEDLRVFGAVRDHSNPAGSTDTNGCSEEQYPWGPNPPQAANDWPCPGGDDDAEGNSHPFHPTQDPTHEVAEQCLPAFYGPNPANHGGSSYITPSMRANDAGWFEFAAPCDYLHATRNIDIYFNGGGRPFPPPVRNFVVVDLEGSSAPYQDYHCSYQGAPCDSEPVTTVP